MGQSPKKVLFLGLMALLGIFFAHIGTAAGADAAPIETILQPQALNHVGIFGLRESAPDLTGTGVKIAVICRSITYIDGEPQNDYRPNTEHNCFTGKQFAFHEQAGPVGGISPHSTAVCSILFGENPAGFNSQLGQFYYEGAAPDAEGDIYEFWDFLINNVFAGVAPEADIVTASIGNQFEDWWTRGIDSLAEQSGLIIVSGIGNGSNVHDPILYPGAGANVIGVGVVDTVDSNNLAIELANLALAYPEHSSFGPTIDGRCKPDIVAPGNCLAADSNDPNRYEPTGSWSSFSTPIAAGTIGLLVQKAKQDPNLSLALSPDGGNCVIKAILMNSATKLPYWHKGRLATADDHGAPLDYIQGAGMLNAEAAYQNLTAGPNPPGQVKTTGWYLNRLDVNDNSENIYQITLEEPAGKNITVTTVWNKHYESVYPFEHLFEMDANLRLELWAVDPNNPDKDYLLDYSDSSIDNIEHIYHQADANFTNYGIVVSYSNIDDPNQINTTQPYGLSWNVTGTTGNKSILWYDLNADGIVNELDISVFLDNMFKSRNNADNYLFGDIDTDGTIGRKDLRILFDHTGLKAEWHAQ